MNIAARILSAFSGLLVFGLLARELRAQSTPAAAWSDDATASPALAARAPVALSAPALDAGPSRVLALIATRREEARTRRDSVAAAATFSRPTPCLPGGSATPAPPATTQCDDADRDGRCDVVFDPRGKGGFWKSLGRFLVLSWIWDRDDDR